MTTSGHDEPMALLDAYLDGVLDGPQRSALEERISHDLRLQAMVQAQHEIDAALQRLFLPPASERLNNGFSRKLNDRMERQSRRPVLHGLRRPLVAAAVLVLGAVSLWLNREHLWPEPAIPHYVPQPWRPLAAAYQFELDNGLTPDWVCKNDRQFSDTFRFTLGQALALAPRPSGVTAGGICYRNVITPKTIVVLGKVDEEPVTVFVDRLEADSGQTLPSDSTLRLYRKELGNVVLYEVSRLEAPRLLDLFYDPDSPPAPAQEP